MSMVVGLGNAMAQTQFEGEVTFKCHSVQKAKSQVTTKNVLAKAIVKSIMKKNFDNNPGFYTGTYTMTSITKGDKNRTNTPYNNSVTVQVKEGDKISQLIIVPVKYEPVELVDDLAELGESERGNKGFGSTGR